MLQLDHSVTPSILFSIAHSHNKHQDESDDEEKRALLAEENIQQLEDAEKVCNRDVICRMSLYTRDGHPYVQLSLVTLYTKELGIYIYIYICLTVYY